MFLRIIVIIIIIITIIIIIIIIIIIVIIVIIITINNNNKGINTLLANGLSTFFIKDKPTFINGLLSLPRNPPDCVILNSSVSENFILAGNLFAKVLRRLATCLSVYDSLLGKLILSSLIIFNDNVRVT